LRKIKKLLIWIAIASVAATVYLITANLGGPIEVDVAGEVASPDVYELERGSRVQEAIAMAGGLTENADAGYLNQAAVLHDGDKLYVPTKEAEPDKTPQDTEGSTPDTEGTPQDYQKFSTLFNLRQRDPLKIFRNNCNILLEGIGLMSGFKIR
jgi:hypothetical protein